MRVLTRGRVPLWANTQCRPHSTRLKGWVFSRLALAARLLADVRDRQQRLDRVLADELRHGARAGGLGLEEAARELALVEREAPPVGVRAGLAAPQGEPREREDDVGGDVALHPQKLAHGVLDCTRIGHVDSHARPSNARRPASPGGSLPGGRRRGGAAAIVGAGRASSAFARSLGNGFTYDEGLVSWARSPSCSRRPSARSLTSDYFGASLEGTWRPFCTLTYMLDALVAFAPAVFKADSLLWHIGGRLARHGPRAPPPARAHRRYALVAGLVFALHPVTAETVDNASFREDSLVTFLTLATLILALDGRAGAGARRVRARPPVEGVGGRRARAARAHAARPVRRADPARLERPTGRPRPRARGSALVASSSLTAS